MQLLKILFLLTLVGVTGCESREAASRRKIAKSLKQLGLALQAYNAKHPEPASNTKPEFSDETPKPVAPEAEGSTSDK